MNTTRPNARCLVSLAALIAMASASVASRAEDSASVEKELIAVLRSDGPSADKAIACKKLAIHGSGAAVPELAKLLSDPQLSSWARIALEAIPGPAADEALTKAAESLDGKLLVGTINSIGVRRGAVAVVCHQQRDVAADRAVFDGVADQIVDRLAHAVGVAHGDMLRRRRDLDDLLLVHRGKAIDFRHLADQRADVDRLAADGDVEGIRHRIGDQVIDHRGETFGCVPDVGDLRANALA